jgi:superfamily II DNA or RNA helicase
MKAYKSGRWDGWIRLVHRNGTFPTGIVPLVMKSLMNSGEQVSLSSEFSAFKETLPFVEDDLDLPFALWPHQIDAISIALTKKRRTILSPTSSGKSLIIYCIARTMIDAGLKILVVVPSVMLVQQMSSDFADYSVKNNWDVEGNVHSITAGENKNTRKPITVSTWQSLQNIKDPAYFEQFDAVFGDEAHGAKATELSSIMEQCVNAFYRIGLTGTLDGDKANELTVQGHFGPTTRVAETKELQDLGQVSNVKIHTHILKYTDPQFLKAVKGLPYKDEIQVIVNKKSRNNYIQKVVGELEGNTLILCMLVETHVKPLAEQLQLAFPEKQVYILSAKTKKEERERLRKLAELESNLIFISTYALFSTGVSIKNLHNCVFAHPLKGCIKILQSIGRVLRLHASKEFANVIDIADDFRGTSKKENYALSHFIIRANLYRQEKFPINIVEAQI